MDPQWEIGAQTVRTLALSPDGQRLAVAIGSQAGPTTPSDIWIKELDTGPMSKLTFEGGNNAPTWTPDGQTLLYASTPPDDPNVLARLFRIQADGTGAPEPLPTDPRGVVNVHTAGRDGWVVVQTNPNGAGAGDILAFRLGVDTTLTPLLATPANEFQPRLSPDGRWLAYMSTESGTAEIYVRPFPDVGRGKWQVSLNGGYFPRWAHSGAELFYLNLGNNLTVAEIQTSPAFSVGRRQVLHNAGAVPDFDVAPGDQRFLRLASLASSDSTGTQVVLVQNFLAELKSRVPR